MEALEIENIWYSREIYRASVAGKSFPLTSSRILDAPATSMRFFRYFIYIRRWISIVKKRGRNWYFNHAIIVQRVE